MPNLSVVIPVYNEVDTIEQIVEAVRGSVIDDLEIILVDDGYTDGTREVLRQKIEPKVARVTYHERNRGKGACSAASGILAETRYRSLFRECYAALVRSRDPGG